MIVRHRQINLFAVAVAQILVMVAPHIVEASETDVANSGPAKPTTDQTTITQPPTVEPKVAGNPLWAISIDQLSNTRQRPLFSPGRRPPLAMAIQPVAAAPIVVSLPPEQPQLSLVGAIAGEQDGIGLFIEQSTRKVFRLRIGEAHQGWVLRSIRSRAVSLEKGGRLVLVEMPPVTPLFPQASTSPTPIVTALPR
jgi:hypothetical protein